MKRRKGGKVIRPTRRGIGGGQVRGKVPRKEEVILQHPDSPRHRRSGGRRGGGKGGANRRGGGGGGGRRRGCGRGSGAGDPADAPCSGRIRGFATCWCRLMRKPPQD